MDLKYELIPAELPKIDRICKSKYDIILDKFIEMGSESARLDIENVSPWFASYLRSLLKRRNIPGVEMHVRNKRIYLVRKF